MDLEKEIKREIKNLRSMETKAYNDQRIKLANQLGQVLIDLSDSAILAREEV